MPIPRMLKKRASQRVTDFQVPRCRIKRLRGLHAVTANCAGCKLRTGVLQAWYVPSCMPSCRAILHAADAVTCNIFIHSYPVGTLT
jgi:hypothetical protein